MTSVNHAELAEALTATAPQVRLQVPQLQSGAPIFTEILDKLVTQQAAMIGYIDNFLLMLVFTLAVFPILPLLRKPPKSAGAQASHAAISE